MITQSFIDLGATIAAWIATLFPATPDLGAAVSSTSAKWGDLMASFTGLGVWVDWAWLLSIVGLVVGVYAVMFVVKLARAVASYLPLIGGAG